MEYLANGWNGVRAYLSSHPECTSYNGACVEAYRTLRLPKIRAAIDELQGARFKRLEMSGDEAIALLSLSARADIGDAYDDEGKPLPLQQWPDSLRLAVKAVRADGSIVLHDGLKARELMAIAQKRLRSTVDVLHNFDHAAYLAGETEPKE